MITRSGPAGNSVCTKSSSQRKEFDGIKGEAINETRTDKEQNNKLLSERNMNKDSAHKKKKITRDFSFSRKKSNIETNVEIFIF